MLGGMFAITARNKLISLLIRMTKFIFHQRHHYLYGHTLGHNELTSNHYFKTTRKPHTKSTKIVQKITFRNIQIYSQWPQTWAWWRTQHCEILIFPNTNDALRWSLHFAIRCPFSGLLGPQTQLKLRGYCLRMYFVRLFITFSCKILYNWQE